MKNVCSSKLELLWLSMTVIGIVFPYYYFIQFYQEYGASMSTFFDLIYANSASAGLAMDLSMAAAAFLIWSYIDAKRNNITWWIVPVLSLTIGVSAGLPFYLYLKERTRRV